MPQCEHESRLTKNLFNIIPSTYEKSHKFLIQICFCTKQKPHFYKTLFPTSNLATKIRASETFSKLKKL